MLNPDASSQIVLVCEHASAFIPAEFEDLGLEGADLQSHIAWDPGAFELARAMAEELDAILVASNVSRLVYDCNRPPTSEAAMPVRSEIVDIPGNKGLTADERAGRVAAYYTPFRDCLAEVMASRAAPVLVTVHSFTPVFHGKPRKVEIGVLHDEDSRLADALLAHPEAHQPYVTLRNEPYGPQDGVTHTLRTHAIGQGHLNVMLEVRNDLIRDAESQRTMAAALSAWLRDALSATEAAICRT